MDLVAQGQLEEGIAELEIAYDTLPHPNVLYNIGRAYAEAGRYEDAVEYFERYIESDPPDRAEVQSFLSALQNRIAARQQAAAATTTPTTAPTPEAPPVEQIDVSSEEILALEESATQIAALAEATQSDSLRDRAERLRALAESLRRRQAAADERPTTTTEPTEVATTTPTETPTTEEPALGLGEQRTDLFEEEVVSASRFAESPLDAPNSTHIITRQDIRLSGLTDLGQLMRRVAGTEVMTHYASMTDVGIRGANQRQSNKVLWLIDGRTVRLDFLGSPWTQQLPIGVEDIERIEVIRGPAAAVYGADAFSGIINIITRSPNESQSYVRLGGGSRNTARGSAGVSGRTGPISVRVSGGYERADAFVRPVGSERVDYRVSDVFDNTRASYERTYISADARFDFGRGFVARAGGAYNFGAGSIQGISRLREVPVNDFFLGQTHFTLTTPIGVGLRVYWNRMFANADGTFEMPPNALSTFGRIEQDVIDTELNFNRTFQLGVPHTFAMGVGHRFKGVDWDWMLEPRTEQHLFAYIQDALQLHERLRLTVSLRLDRHPLLEGIQFSPRGSLVWRFLDGNSLRFTGGTAFRSPAFLESYLNFSNRTPLRAATALATGNENLSPERIVSLELGYMNQATDYFSLEANLYYNLIFNQIVLASVNPYRLRDWGAGRAGYDAGRDAFPLGELQFNNEDAVFRQVGGELGVRAYPVRGLDVYANYAYHDTSPTDSSAFQDNPVRGRDRRTSAHKINLGVQYRTTFGLDFNVDFHWVSNQVWVEQVTDTLTGVRFQDFPLDGYVLLNARVGYRLFNDRLELGVTGTNLTFQRIRQHPLSQPMDTRIIGDVALRF
ncbi:MAG: TonB-dependent receptor [Myxococcales bacterium]|nr:TonB-dependent receptor [Myxococcales bacterium]